MEILEMQNLCVKAYGEGKIRDAESYAEKALLALFELKRMPAMSQFIIQIKNLGYPLKKIKRFENLILELRGELAGEVNHMEWHIDYFKSSQEFFREYLLEQDEWGKTELQYCYEYILRFGHDPEIFSRINKLTKDSVSTVKADNESRVEAKSLNKNYEQLAYDLISGKKTVEDLEQAKIIASLKLLDLENMQEQGKEMATAFRFLGMDDVVIFLCHKIIPTTKSIKDRASLTYLIAESHINQKDYLHALQAIENFLRREPVFGDEKLAFLYLQAEVYLLLDKKEEARKYFQEIYKTNPHYRLVKQRLKTFEIN